VGGVARAPVVDERTARVFVASQRSGAISVLDARDGRLLRTVAVARGPLGPTAAPVVDDVTGRVFFAADAARDNLIVLDARNGTMLRRFTVGAFPQAIALDRGAGRVLVANGGRVTVLDARDGRPLRTAPLIGTPRTLLIDESAQHAFASYSDNVDISMLDTATGATLRSTPVRLDHTILGRRQVIDQAENEIYPLVDRIDERMRWVVVRVPQVMADDGPEQGPSQIAVLDSRTATRIHTVFSEPTWPDAVAVDEQRGRAFSDVGGAINVYDISCLTTYYIFGDMG
jgi:DNA-binding beta-propeller fold protein YncE